VPAERCCLCRHARLVRRRCCCRPNTDILQQPNRKIASMLFDMPDMLHVVFTSVYAWPLAVPTSPHATGKIFFAIFMPRLRSLCLVVGNKPKNMPTPHIRRHDISRCARMSWSLSICHARRLSEFACSRRTRHRSVHLLLMSWISLQAATPELNQRRAGVLPAIAIGHAAGENREPTASAKPAAVYQPQASRRTMSRPLA